MQLSWVYGIYIFWRIFAESFMGRMTTATVIDSANCTYRHLDI